MQLWRVILQVLCCTLLRSSASCAGTVRRPERVRWQSHVWVVAHGNYTQRRRVKLEQRWLHTNIYKLNRLALPHPNHHRLHRSNPPPRHNAAIHSVKYPNHSINITHAPRYGHAITYRHVNPTTNAQPRNSGVPHCRIQAGYTTVGYPTRICAQEIRQWGTPLSYLLRICMGSRACMWSRVSIVVGVQY